MGLLLRERREGKEGEREGNGEGKLPPLKFRSGYATVVIIYVSAEPHLGCMSK